MTKCVVIPRNINSHDPMWITNTKMHDLLANMYPDTGLSSAQLILSSTYVTQGLYFLSEQTSYHKISRTLEAVRFRFLLFQSLCNLTDTSAAAIPTCLWIIHTIGRSESFSCNLLNSSFDSMILAKPTFNLWNVCRGNCFYIPLWNVIIHPCHNISRERPMISQIKVWI